MINQYLENLKGSPYINEVGFNPINPFKGWRTKSKMNTIGNQQPPVKPSQQPKTQLSKPDEDFVKIVKVASEMLIEKLNDLKRSKTKSAITEEENTEETPEKPNSRETTTKPVAAKEEDAESWIDWFHGQYWKSRKVGLDMEGERNVELSNKSIKSIKLKWSNNRHENKILVIWSNGSYKQPQLDFDKKPEVKQKPNSEPEFNLKEAEVPTHKDRGQFVLFRFYDDQITPGSPSYQNNPPTIRMFLKQANPHSDIIDRIKDNAELSKLNEPLVKSLLKVVEQKWTEFGGHKLNPEKVKFTVNQDKSITYKSLSKEGGEGNMSLHVINSILEMGDVADDKRDPNLADTGLDYIDFVNALKKAGLKSEDLSTDKAKDGFNIDIHGNKEEKETPPSETDKEQPETSDEDIKSKLELNDEAVWDNLSKYYPGLGNAYKRLSQQDEFKNNKRDLMNKLLILTKDPHTGLNAKSDAYINLIRRTEKNPEFQSQTPIKKDDSPSVDYSNIQSNYIKLYPQLKSVIDIAKSKNKSNNLIDNIIILNLRKRSKDKRNLEKTINKISSLEEYKLKNLLNQ